MAAVIQGRAPQDELSSLATNLIVVEILAVAQQSAQQGRTVPLPPTPPTPPDAGSGTGAGRPAPGRPPEGLPSRLEAEVTAPFRSN